jgi:hypothetical protein
MQFEFDAACKHLAEQSKQSIINHGDCKYRSVGRYVLSCAVGCRIPDSIYNEDMDNIGMYPLAIEYKSKAAPEEIKQYIDMFAELQGIHDDPDSWLEEELSEYGIEQLHCVALTYNLTCNL